MSIKEISSENEVQGTSSVVSEDTIFIGPADIRGKMQEILDMNEGDSDENITELIALHYPDAGKGFSRDGNGFLKKIFGSGGYIRLIEKENNEVVIDMIQLQGDGVRAMLEIFSYCILNGCKTISGKVQPQKKPSPRRKEILKRFYANYGFTCSDGTNMTLNLTEENKKVLVNKIKYYLEKGKWFTS